MPGFPFAECVSFPAPLCAEVIIVETAKSRTQIYEAVWPRAMLSLTIDACFFERLEGIIVLQSTTLK